MDLQVVSSCVSGGCDTTAAFHGHGLSAAGLRRRIGWHTGRRTRPAIRQDRKREHRILGVGRCLDAGVGNSEIIEPARPLIKLIATFYEELKVIEAGVNVVKRFAGVALMSDEAEDQSTLRLEKADVAHATVWRTKSYTVCMPNSSAYQAAHSSGSRTARLTSMRPVIEGTFGIVPPHGGPIPQPFDEPGGPPVCRVGARLLHGGRWSLHVLSLCREIRVTPLPVAADSRSQSLLRRLRTILLILF